MLLLWLPFLPIQIARVVTLLDRTLHQGLPVNLFAIATAAKLNSGLGETEKDSQDCAWWQGGPLAHVLEQTLSTIDGFVSKICLDLPLGSHVLQVLSPVDLRTMGTTHKRSETPGSAGHAMLPSLLSVPHKGVLQGHRHAPKG